MAAGRDGAVQESQRPGVVQRPDLRQHAGQQVEDAVRLLDETVPLARPVTAAGWADRAGSELVLNLGALAGPNDGTQQMPLKARA
jgi:hypothetical protein